MSIWKNFLLSIGVHWYVSLLPGLTMDPLFLVPDRRTPTLSLKHLMLSTFEDLSSIVTCPCLVWDCESTIAVSPSLLVTNKFSFLSSFVLNIWISVAFQGIWSKGKLQVLQLLNSSFPIRWKISLTETGSFVKTRWYCFIIAKNVSCGRARVISCESTIISRSSIFWQAWSTDFLTFIRNHRFCNGKSIYPLQVSFLFVDLQLTECLPDQKWSIYSTSWGSILRIS